MKPIIAKSMRQDRDCLKTNSFIKKMGRRLVLALCCLLMAISWSIAQETTIEGYVKDEGGQPLQGVSIVLSGAKNGVVTDSAGYFQLHAGKSGPLQISFTGYVTQQVTATAGERISIVLIADKTDLNAVVVVGYGKQKRANLTGSVATISGAELKESPASNLTNVIAGRLPGVVALNGNGRPGSGSSLQVRGYSTLNNNDPLYVIDGIVRSDGFANLDPNEVENITILKDASASAVYGARAANGVILVTTKRGKTGKPSFTYNALVGTQRYTKYPDMMNSYQYASIRNQALLNQGYNPANPAQAGMFYKEEQLQRYQAGEGTNWYDLVFKGNNLQTQHNLSMSGGTDAIRYFSSLSYVFQDGMFDNIDFKRYNFRTNIDAKITKTLTAGLNLEARREIFSQPGWDANTIFQYIQLTAPTLPAYTQSGLPFNTDGAHPVEMVYHSGYNRNIWNVFQGTLTLEQKLDFVTPGLSVRATGSSYQQHLFGKLFFLPHKMYTEDANGNITGSKVTGGVTSLSEQYQKIDNITLNMAVHYARTFGFHEVSALALYEQFSSDGDGFNATKKDFSTDIKDDFFASGPANQTIGGNRFINDYRRSVVGRLNYAYNAKYLFEATFRYDGSYRFPPNSRYGFFPAFSAGWRISKERFFEQTKALSFVTDLKLRVSKGLIGNDRVSAFQFMDAYTITTGAGPIVDGQPLPYVVYGVYPNANITWEKQDNTNLGLDVQLFDSKLGLEFDYFFRTTRDTLWSRDRSVPATFGRTLPNENYAQMKSQGFEFTLSYRNRIHELDYNMRLIGSFASNKVTQIDDPANALDYQKQLNKPYGYFSGYRAVGIFQTQDEVSKWYGGNQFGSVPKPGNIKYADVDGDGKITITDQEVLAPYGNLPRIMYGFAGGLRWKQFDMNFLIQGAAQRKLMLSGGARVMFNNGSYNNYTYLADSWTVDNPGAKYPMAWVSTNGNDNRNSSLWMRDGGYARLKSIDIGYNFAPKLVGKKFNQLRLYVSGTNLVTVSQFDEFDPEAETGGGWYYPQQRSLNIGLNISF